MWRCPDFCSTRYKATPSRTPFPQLLFLLLCVFAALQDWRALLLLLSDRVSSPQTLLPQPPESWGISHSSPTVWSMFLLLSTMPSNSSCCWTVRSSVFLLLSILYCWGYITVDPFSHSRTSGWVSFDHCEQRCKPRVYVWTTLWGKYAGVGSLEQMCP